MNNYINRFVERVGENGIGGEKMDITNVSFAVSIPNSRHPIHYSKVLGIGVSELKLGATLIPEQQGPL